MLGALAPALILWLATGHPLPSTGTPKSPLATPWLSPLFVLQHAAGYLAALAGGLLLGVADPGLLGPLNQLDPAALSPPLGLLLFVVGALPRVTRELAERRLGLHTLLVGWFVVGVLLQAVVHGGSGQGFRHLQPYLLGFYPYLIAGALDLARLLVAARDGGARQVAIAGRCAAGLVLVLQLPLLCGSLLGIARSARGLLPYRDAAAWIAAQLPPDAAVATFDVGVLGVFAERPVFDLYGLGLVTPEMRGVAPYFADVMGSIWLRVLSLPAARRPAWVVLHRQRYEEYGDDDHLAPLRGQAAFVAADPPGPVRAIGRDLTVYRVAWPAEHPEPCRAALRTGLADGRWTIVDRLAPAARELCPSHRHRITPEAPLLFPSNRLVAMRCGDEMVTDAVLGIAGREYFELVLDDPAAGALLVMRSPSFSQPPEVVVNGLPVGRLVRSEISSGGWLEALLELPPPALGARRA